MPRNNWTRDELILAINLYCRIPFGTIHQRNPKVIELAALINRTPGAIGWKLVNFAHIDSSLDRVGASNVSKLDRDVWTEFFNDWEKLAYESERVRAHYLDLSIEKASEIETVDLPEGPTERERVVKTRVNQAFFRRVVLSSYDFKCCITGLPIPKLLRASHIVPWSESPEHRMNPCNGLCLAATQDVAFDRHLISFDDDYRLILSKSLREHVTNQAFSDAFLKYEGCIINFPKRFRPSLEFLEIHRNIFSNV